jgi:hypothetical protein
VNRSGSIFELPPARIEGNIFNPENEEEIVLGYFEVAKTDTLSFTLYSSEFDTYIPPTCPDQDRNFWRNFNGQPLTIMGISPQCIDCTSVRNSTTEKPSFID